MASPATVRGGRREEMVRAAARLFSERGYHGTSMQDLAGVLGVLRGSLYAHIGSKEELLHDVVERGAQRFLERGADAVALDAPAPERLRAFLVGHIETAIEQLEAGTVFLNEWRYLSDERRADITRKRHRYEDMVRTILSEGIRRGQFRADIDVPLAARLVLSAGNWIYAWYREGGEMSPRDVGTGFADMLVRGLEDR